MSFYCLCTGNSIYVEQRDRAIPRNGPVAFASSEIGYNLPTAMRAETVGATQVVPNGDGTYRRHHPNVDVFVCTRCGARMVRS